MKRRTTTRPGSHRTHAPAAGPKDMERTFHRPIFEPNGAITYPKTQGDWEPPQDISGYVRDPDNKWRFLPLWLPCGLRSQMAFLKPNCGCIDIINAWQQPTGTRVGNDCPTPSVSRARGE